MTGVVLQVRLGSTRLPNKALLPLGGKKVIELAMEALRMVRADMFIVATEGESSEALRPIVERGGFELFVGSKEDVLSRYVGAIREFSLDRVIRATGDNPLVSGGLANLLLDRSHGMDRPPDYLAFDGPPLGTGVEVVKGEALRRAHRESDDPYCREHVCPYLYRNPRKFSICRLEAPAEYQAPEYRVTLDTPEDYSRLKTIFRDLYTGAPIETDTLLAYLKGGLGH